jgi:hypothetical protein
MAGETQTWTDRVRTTLESYEESLLRRVAGHLCRPRSQWPVADLIDRCVDTIQNPAVLDRRLKSLTPDVRRVLTILRYTDQTRWPVGTLCELGALLGVEFGPEAVAQLIEGGILYPDQPANGKLKNLDAWLAQAPRVFVPPIVPQRLAGEELGIEPFESLSRVGPTQEADGLEWLLRLAVLQQIVQPSPLRRTQSGDFFKRDLDRLRGDALLGTPVGDALEPLQDAELFAVALARAAGVLDERDGELKAAAFPASWQRGLSSAVAELWSALVHVESWDPVHGWRIAERPGSPFASAWLYAMAALASMPAEVWVRADDIQERVAKRHPFWADWKDAGETGVTKFLLGVAYPLRLLQAAKIPSGWAVRLSPMGREVLHLGPAVTIQAFPQTLLVQPNLEILAYRQGLTSDLIPRLGSFANWKTLGAACTLQFEPSSVYRALEMGETFESIVQTLDRHGMKPTPAAVLDALRTWSNKRDRITLYPSAALFEFASAADLTEALNRGLPAVRLTERVAVVPRESDIDYKHFRLTGTRDYCLPPERCVEIEGDGITLVVDLARSDLLLETELARFAEPSTRTAPQGKKYYRITPASLKQARQQGLTLANLEAWFEQRTGGPASAACRFLYSAVETPPPELKRQIVVHVASAETADGLLQWPGTQTYFQGRLGPTTLIVLEADVEPLTTVLRDLGMTLKVDAGS